MSTTHPEPPHPMLDKQHEARQEAPGTFKRFLAWLDEQGWKWCSFGGTHRLHPAPSQLPLTIAKAMDLIPTDQAGNGSNDLGEWLESCNEHELVLAKFTPGSGTAAIIDKLERERRSSPEATQRFYDYRDWPQNHPDYEPAGWFGVGSGINDILGKFYGIDLQQAEEERMALLKWIRERNGQ